jgi:hypothetical protein
MFAVDHAATALLIKRRFPSAPNLANLSLFAAAIPGPEQFLAHRPLALVTLILVQIVTTLVLVAVFAERKGSTHHASDLDGRPVASPAH